MPTYDLIQRITEGKRPVPMLKKISEETGLETLIYRGPECISIEHAVTVGLNELKKEFLKCRNVNNVENTQQT